DGEVGEGNLPGAAMVATGNLAYPLDDNRLIVVHGPTQAPRMAWSSSLTLGRWPGYSTLRPNSTASVGGMPEAEATRQALIASYTFSSSLASCSSEAASGPKKP